MLYKLHYELLEKIHSSWNRIRISPYPQILSTFDPLSVCIRKKKSADLSPQTDSTTIRTSLIQLQLQQQMQLKKNVI